FFNQLEQLSAHPDDLTERSVFVNNASALTNQLNSVSGSFATLRENTDAQLQEAIAQVNSLARQISELNVQIQRIEVRGVNANDLRDQRDQLINQLAGYIDVQSVEQGVGLLTVTAAGAALAAGTQAGA